MVDLWEFRLEISEIQLPCRVSNEFLYLCEGFVYHRLSQQQPRSPKPSHISCLTLAVLLPAAAAAAFFVQEEAVKAEGDTEDDEGNEEDVKQAADEDESEDAETEKGCKHLVSTH